MQKYIKDTYRYGKDLRNKLKVTILYVTKHANILEAIVLVVLTGKYQALRINS
jgi:hypothetical protein